MAATAGLAIVAVRGIPPVLLITRMLLMMLCAQCAIGAVNDIADRDLDAATKPWKPVASGFVSYRAAVALSLVFLAAAVALAATLGLAGFALAIAGIASGLAYDLRLKRTAVSAVPFMVAIPVLPLWVWASLDVWDPVLWWLIPLGALIGVALHLANTLPDLEDDAAHGVEGLAHRLGARRSLLLAWGSFAAALALSAAIAPAVEYDVPVYVAVVVLGSCALAGSAAAYAIVDRDVAARAGFGLLSLASAALAVGWLAAAT